MLRQGIPPLLADDRNGFPHDEPYKNEDPCCGKDPIRHLQPVVSS